MAAAVAYIRVSSEGQVNGDGPDRQRRVIAEWAQRTGTTITQEYLDLAVSGTKAADDRPAMARMISDLASSGGLPPVIAIERQDRLARDLIEGELIIRKLRRLGVQIVLAETGQPLGEDASPTGVLVRQILGAVAEFDRSSIVGKLRSARVARKTATGRCEGQKPYGFRAGESETINVMMQRRSAGATYAAIAAHLNANSLPPRRGKCWTRSTVFKVLRSQAQATC